MLRYASIRPLAFDPQIDSGGPGTCIGLHHQSARR